MICAQNEFICDTLWKYIFQEQFTFLLPIVDINENGPWKHQARPDLLLLL